MANRDDYEDMLASARHDIDEADNGTSEDGVSQAYALTAIAKVLLVGMSFLLDETKIGGVFNPLPLR